MQARSTSISPSYADHAAAAPHRSIHLSTRVTEVSEHTGFTLPSHVRTKGAPDDRSEPSRAR